MINVEKIKGGIKISNGEKSFTITKNEDKWITIRGTHILIKDGQSAGTAIKEFFKSKEKSTKKKQVETSKSVDAGKMLTAETKKFKESISDAKKTVPEEARWRVDVHEDYSDIKKLYVSNGGSTVAVEDNGNIVSVCVKKGDTVRGSELIKKAVESGGDRLDAFDGLYGFYAKQGFEPVSWCEFDENYAPDGWKSGRDEKEPVVFWKYTGKIHTESKEDFYKRVKPSRDYDSAEKARNDSIKGKTK